MPASGAGALRAIIEAVPKVGFVLFILLNAVLFIRPTELFPQLNGLPAYELLFVACLVTLFPGIIRQLSPRSLANSPITVCILGLFVAVILSHAGRLNFRDAFDSGKDYAKLVVYYLLFVAAVNTSKKLQTFLLCLAIFASIQIGLGVLQHHHVINFAALQPEEEMALGPSPTEAVKRYRICGVGIFHDPNDLAVLAAATVGLCLYQVSQSFHRRDWARWGGMAFWAGAMMLSAHALWLTRSRGGFLALMAGLGAFFFARFGWKKSILIGLVVMPLLLKAFAGRQTDIRMITRTTGQMRLSYWAEGLNLLAGSPVFGIGQGNFGRAVGTVAHNSFIHCFTELGLIGGMLFLGAFFLSIWPVYRMPLAETPENAELSRLRPYLLAIATAWTMGMMSLSRAYVPPTYVIPALAAVFLALATPREGHSRSRVNALLVGQIAGLSAAFLVGVFVFVKAFYR